MRYEMNALVLEKLNDDVILQSEFGLLKGVWCSDSPTIKKIYNLEIECNEILQKHMIKILSIKKETIKCDNNFIYLYGIAESIENDILYLRIKTDVIMLETDPMTSFFDYSGKNVCITLNKLYFYNTGIL